MKLSQDVINELKDTDSIKRKDEIVGAMETRVSKIATFIAKLTHNSSSYWWAWRYYEREETQPDFDSDFNMRDNLLIYSLCECGFSQMHEDVDGNQIDLTEEIPIKWLWEDYEKDIKDGLKRYKDKEAKEKAQKAARSKELKELKIKYQKSAKAKLTPEELWAVGLSKKFPKSLKALKD